MAFDEYLADRIRQNFNHKQVDYFEKKMMGGLAFMVDEKMCVGVNKDQLMARIGPDAQEEAMQRPGCQVMDFTGKPMKGYVFVNPEGYDMEDDLDYYLQKALDFNPLAKASKKRKKK